MTQCIVELCYLLEVHYVNIRDLGFYRLKKNNNKKKECQQMLANSMLFNNYTAVYNNEGLMK